MFNFNITTFISIVIFTISAHSSDPTVTIDCGKLKGKLIETKNGNCDAYVGVPFAAPPTGILRWKKPQEPICWKGIKEVKTFAHQCIQSGTNGTNTKLESEDCLYLNIFIPKSVSWSNNLLPVMVFIPGGAFEVGSAIEYGQAGVCENLASRGAIVVIIQYRLFMYGFYSTGDQAALGNYGIWDQIQALKWVQTNIDQFGGDPNKVTVFGESAGAASVSFITYTPVAKDLFHQSLSESGSALTMWALMSNASIPTAQNLAKAANCTGTDSEALTNCLRKLSTIDLQKIYNNMNLSSIPFFFKWGIRVDGELFTHDKLEDLKSGKPAVIGVNSFEELPDVKNIPRAIAIFNKNLNNTFSGNNPIENEVLKQITQYVYIDSKGDRNNQTFVAQQSGRLNTDIMFHVPAAVEATVKATGGSPVWVYNFDYYSANVFPSNYPFEKGSPHAHELCYLFLMVVPEAAKKYFTCPDNYEGEYRKIADYLGEMWTNFVINGDPSPKDIKWPQFHNVFSANTMHIRSNLTIDLQYFADAANFWAYLKPNIQREFGHEEENVGELFDKINTPNS